MNEKEIGEIRRHVRRDRCNMTAVYGCYVNNKKEIVSQYRRSAGLMSENEAERYFSLMRRTLSGTVGKNLIDITFSTAQVADSDEHRLLMQLRNCKLEDEQLRMQLVQKIVDSVTMDDGYLILLGCDTYDVPFKQKDGSIQQDNSTESYSYLLCAVCPVKQTKANLHYVAEDQVFHDGGITQVATAPKLGFLFPAFDDRATNIYSALFYTGDSAADHAQLIDSVFHVSAPQPAAQQKKSFESLLRTSLNEECSYEVLQTVHDRLCQQIELHKESRVPEALLIGKEDVKQSLADCGVSQEHIAKFSVDFDNTFGLDSQLHPKNVINHKKFEIHTPDVSIRVNPERSDLIETRIIGGVKYILICADEDVEVNGVPIQITE